MTGARLGRAGRARGARPLAARLAGLALVVLLLGVVAGEREVARADDMATRDWTYSLYVVSDLATHPVETPVVLLLGGSATRECTTSDRSWREQIARQGGPVVVTRNLSSRNQTFAQDLHLVRMLPSAPTIVFIGVNVGRFFADPATPFGLVPGPFERPFQHRYSQARLLAPQGKERVAAEWMSRRYAPFGERFDDNLEDLEELVATSLRQGLHPVLLDMPRNVAVIGDRLDVPVGEYSRACAGLAARYQVPFVSFVTRAGLTSDDFFDIAHLVEPGRAKWQTLLSHLTVELLREYGLAYADGPPQASNGVLHDWCVSGLTGSPVFVPQGGASTTLASTED